MKTTRRKVPRSAPAPAPTALAAVPDADDGKATVYALQVRKAITAYHEMKRLWEGTEDAPDWMGDVFTDVESRLVKTILRKPQQDACPPSCLSHGVILDGRLYLAMPEDRDAGEPGYKGEDDGVWVMRLLIVELSSIVCIDPEGGNQP